jgi:hypothetical protein
MRSLRALKRLSDATSVSRSRFSLLHLRHASTKFHVLSSRTNDHTMSPIEVAIFDLEGGGQRRC